MRWLSLLLAVALALGACTTDVKGARLELETDEFQMVPAECSLGAIPAFRIERDGTEVVFVDVGTEKRHSITWPFGFAAWLEFDAAVLYATDGTLVGREGGVLENIGAVVVEGGGYRVCRVGVRSY